MRIGFTKAYRKELDSDVWKMPPLYQRVFFYLRQEAVWQPETFPTRKGYGIALNPGQLITSYSSLAEGVSWYEYGVKKTPNKKTIKDILKWLESNAMVTAVSNRHGTFIMLTNWDTYNNIGSEEVTQNNQPEVTQEKRSLDTLKEGKESLRSKEINNDDIIITPYIPQKNNFDQFWEAYPKKKNKETARKKWMELVKQKKLPELSVLLKAIEAQKPCYDWQKDAGKYIPYPSTWLNAGGWDNEIIDRRPDFRPETFQQGLKAQIIERNKWLLEETKNEETNAEGHSEGACQVINQLPKPKD